MKDYLQNVKLFKRKIMEKVLIIFLMINIIMKLYKDLKFKKTIFAINTIKIAYNLKMKKIRNSKFLIYLIKRKNYKHYSKFNIINIKKILMLRIFRIIKNKWINKLNNKHHINFHKKSTQVIILLKADIYELKSK